MVTIPDSIEATYVENVLDQSIFNDLIHTVNGNNFGWYLFPDINFSEKFDDITRHGFKHMFIYENEDRSSYAPLVLPICAKAAEVAGHTLNSIFSAYGVLTMNCGKQHEGFPHIDAQQHPETETVKRYSAVYYIEDSDGDTIFYDYEDKQEVFRVTPKKNTMIVFRTNTYHSGSLPMVYPTRKIINLNIGVNW